MNCPKCGSPNVSFQRESSGNVGATKFSYGRRGHSLFWWLLIGWWWKPIWFITFGWWTWIFKRPKRGGGVAIQANKNINRTVAVCQNCGHTWKA